MVGRDRVVGGLAWGVAVFVEFGGDHFAEGASADAGVAEAVEFGADLAGDVAGPVGGFDPVGVAASGGREDELAVGFRRSVAGAEHVGDGGWEGEAADAGAGLVWGWRWPTPLMVALISTVAGTLSRSNWSQVRAVASLVRQPVPAMN